MFSHCSITNSAITFLNLKFSTHLDLLIFQFNSTWSGLTYGYGWTDMGGSFLSLVPREIWLKFSPPILLLLIFLNVLNSIVN